MGGIKLWPQDKVFSEYIRTRDKWTCQRCKKYYNPEEPTDPETNPENIPNPENSYQFTNRMGREFLENNTVAYELKLEKQNVPQPTPPDITDPQV